MDLIDLLVEHDKRLSERLLDGAELLPDEALDEPVLVMPPSAGFGEPAPSLRVMLDRLVQTKEFCTASIRGWALGSSLDTSMSGLHARLQEANASFAQLVREIGERDAWNAVFIDAIHKPPGTETFGAAVEQVLDRDVICCEIIAEALRSRGVESVSLDVIRWQQAKQAGGAERLRAAGKGFVSRSEGTGKEGVRMEFDSPVAELTDKLEEARRELEAGHDSKAAKILDDLVYRTHNHDLLTQIHELGLKGQEHAGRLHRVTWRDIVKETEARLTRPEMV